MANFADLLNKPADSVERPKPLPQGSYNCVVKGLPEQGESKEKKTPFVNFTLLITSPRDDVDEEAIATMGGVVGKTIPAIFYITENSLFRLTDFLEHCGIELAGKSISSAIDESPNSEVVAFIRHEASQDGQSIFGRFSKSAPMNDE